MTRVLRRHPTSRGGRWWAPALALVLGAALLVSCGSTTRAAAGGEPAVLVIDCPVKDAVLWVDGRYVAQVRDLRAGVSLPPGRHQIEIRHERYHAHYGEIDMGRGQRLQISIHLAPQLD